MHVRNLRQVAHEHRREVDDVRAAGAPREDRQTEEHAIGVRDLDGLRVRAALVGRESHVAAHQVNPLTRAAELPDRIVAKLPTESAHDRRLADAAGDRDQHDQVAIEILRVEFREQAIVFAIERDQARDLLRVLEHLVIGRVLRLRLRWSRGGCRLRFRCLCGSRRLGRAVRLRLRVLGRLRLPGRRFTLRRFGRLNFRQRLSQRCFQIFRLCGRGNSGRQASTNRPRRRAQMRPNENDEA